MANSSVNVTGSGLGVTAAAGATVTLQLSTKNVPSGGTNIGYTLNSLMSGPTNAILGGSTVSITAVTAGTYSYELDAYDFESASYAIPIALQITVWTPPEVTTATLPDATKSKAYAATLEATGGAGALTWTVTGGALPAGLTLNAGSGVISGTPTSGTVAGQTSTFTVTVTDENGRSASKSLTIKTYLAPVITVPTLKTTLTEGRAITAATFTVTGGAPPVTWQATGLPSGLTLSSTGTLTGTPSAGSGSAAGTSYTASVTVRDANGATDASEVQLKVFTPPAITAPTIPNATESKALTSFTYTATGAPTLTWSATGLPTWATINASTGAVAGTPTSGSGSSNPTSYSFTVTVTDANGATATTGTQTLKVYKAPAITVPSIQAKATEGKGIASATFVGVGAPPLSWSASGLPDGLTLNASSGALSGTPSAGSGSKTGTSYSFTVSLLDGNGNTSTTAPLSIAVYNPPKVTSSATLQSKATEGRAITTITYGSDGGSPTLTWTATGLPTGMSINSSTGVLSGTPGTNTGSGNPSVYSIVVTVTDANGATDATNPMSLSVYKAPVITIPTLPLLTEGRPVKSPTTFTTTGAAPVSWSATGLPSGVTIDSSSGLLTGSPNSGTGLAAGRAYASVIVTVTDANGATASTAAQTMTVYTAPTISTAPTLQANATETAAISTSTYAATGGAPTRVWSMSGAPSGITINASTGAVSGTPATGAGSASGRSYSITITVTDSNGATATSSQSMTVYTPPTCTNTSLPNGTKGVQYTEKILSSGGYGTLTVSVTGLPAGMNFAANPDQISGKPTKSGTYSVVVKVTDANGAFTTKTLTLVIA